MSTMSDTKRKRSRRSFTDEFKAGAVRLVLEEGKTVGAAARDLDLTESSLRKWVEQARADRTKGKTGLTTAEREELVRLRKELRVAQEERDILKNESRALVRPDLWARNSVAYAHTPEAVAVRFLVTSRAR
jgi:transposase